MEAKISAKTGLLSSVSGLSVVLVWVAQQLGVEVPAEVAVAVLGLIVAVLSYAVPAKSGKYVENPDQDWDGDRLGSMGEYADQDNTEIIELESRGA